jgi:DNA-binding NtrC family response regulator
MVIKVKKILFVGRFNEIISDNNFFKDSFDVQICVDNVKMVKGMLKIKQPELVVISLVGIGKDIDEILGELKMNYSQTPIICIGTDEDIATHINGVLKMQINTLVVPVTKEKIFDTMCDMLGISSNDDTNIDILISKKSILLVDDSNIQLRALNELLKTKYEVRMATSGMQALTLIGKKKPDMIFLDYEMPICDGRMTFKMIKELDEAKDIPVVFLTGVSDKEHIEAVLELKPAGYLLKPANADRIYNIIEKVLG